MTAAELKALGKALVDAEGTVSANAIVCARLIALTGLRHAEATGLQWAEIDFAGRCLRLADTKTGASLRPIGSPALALLQLLHGKSARRSSSRPPAATGTSMG